jgi:hypothetical protein
MPKLDDKAQIAPPVDVPQTAVNAPASPAAELGGRVGPDPTRYGDWELRGRCIDF